MPLIELNIRFPNSNQVIVSLNDDETKLLDFKAPVSKKDLEDLRWYIETYGAQYTGEPDDKEARRIEVELKTLGDALFNAVFATPKAQALFQQFQQQPTDKLLTIQTDEPEILVLPWELLRDPHYHLLCHAQPRISIRRHCVKNLPASFTIQAKPKLRLLFVVSRPNDVSFLDPRLDPQAVLDALAEQKISQIEVEFLRPATFFNLKKRFNNKELPPIDIIHFDGHGIYDEEKQLGYLIFETPRGLREDYSASELSEILVSHQVALVVLSACQSAAVGNKALGSVAAGLTNQGVPTVLAMVYSVLVETTRQLFAAFYQALATGQGIAAALDHARLALASQNKRGTRRRGEGEFELTLQDWFVPALYQTNNDNALLLKDLRGFENLAGLSISNLPTLQTAGFFGRSRELWQIERWFVQGVERITITGFGGQGKTYCAIEAAHWLLRTDLFDSVCFVDFSRYQGLDSLRYALNALGVLLDTTLLDENAVPPILQTRRLLWVLDNLESVAAETLDELLTVAVQWSAHSRFLFTTRQHRFTQADYAESNPKLQYLDLAGLAELDALAYFNQLWQTAPPPEQPYPARYELITLFNKVSFHPLSIGLLAQQLKNRTIAELGERLEALLLCEPENSEDKSLLASLKLSLERLPPEQRELVKRLGVFQGGAIQIMIERITKISTEQWIKISPALENIGLIQIEDLTHLGAKYPYIKFHPTLAYMLWKDLSISEKEKLLLCFCEDYYNLSHTLYKNDSEETITTRAIAKYELPNLLYAVYISLQRQENYAVEFVTCICRFLDSFGLKRDNIALTELAVKTKTSEKEDSEDWFIAQKNLGEKLFNSGNYLEATMVFQKIFNNLNGVLSYKHCITLSNLGSCFARQGEQPLAINCYQQALTIAQSIESTPLIKRQVCVLNSELAATWTDQGEYDEAKKCYDRALMICEETNDVRNKAIIKLELGTWAVHQELFEKAKEYYETSLKLFELFSDQVSKAFVLNCLGAVYQKTEQWQEAEQFYRKSAEIKESQNDLASAAMTWNNLAVLMERNDHFKAARGYYCKAIKAFKKIDNKKELAGNLINLAGLLHNQSSHLKIAQKLAEKSLEISKTLDESSVEIWKTYSCLAEIADKRGQNQQAKQYLHLSRSSYLLFSGMSRQMEKFSTLILGAIKVALYPEQQVELKQYFMELSETPVIKTIQCILNGERNEEVLLESLNWNEAAVIHLILKGIANPKSLETLFNS